MNGFILSPAAQTDVDHIWDDTAANWNIDQAERYIGNIRDTCRAPFPIGFRRHAPKSADPYL
jgi:plasmid stabilization system protein ParE